MQQKRGLSVNHLWNKTTNSKTITTMVQAKDLMVGNKLYKDGIIVTIDARSIFDIWDKSDLYSPIELNDSILISCGLQSNGDGYWEEPNNDFFIKFILKGKYNYVHGISRIGEYIKHLHQLQNLYKSLFATDLKINNL